jgi:hypothetical protein
MLFLKDHRPLILEGIKTETRRPHSRPVSRPGGPQRTRLGRRPARPEALRKFYTRPAFCRPAGTPFCTALILDCQLEPLGDIDVAGAYAEGYSTVQGFVDVWNRIWGAGRFEAQADDEIWVVKLKLIEQLACATCGIPRSVGGSFLEVGLSGYNQAEQCWACRRGDENREEWKAEPDDRRREFCA